LLLLLLLLLLEVVVAENAKANSCDCDCDYSILTTNFVIKTWNDYSCDCCRRDDNGTFEGHGRTDLVRKMKAVVFPLLDDDCRGEEEEVRIYCRRHHHNNVDQDHTFLDCLIGIHQYHGDSQEHQDLEDQPNEHC